MPGKITINELSDDLRKFIESSGASVLDDVSATLYANEYGSTDGQQVEADGVTASSTGYIFVDYTGASADEITDAAESLPYVDNVRLGTVIIASGYDDSSPTRDIPITLDINDEVDFTYTITPSMWDQYGVATISWPGFTDTMIPSVFISSDATPAQSLAFGQAVIFVTARATGSVTLKCIGGTALIPTIDLPVIFTASEVLAETATILYSASWNGQNKQTVTASAVSGAKEVVIIAPYTATDLERAEMAAAMFGVSAVGADMTFECNGTVPSVNIPVSICKVA
jgi:hypothetical protein